MIASLLLLVSSQPLSERAALPPVLDAVIDRQAVDANLGREPINQVGDGKVLLVSFPHLAYTEFPSEKVASARLVLTLVRDSQFEVTSVGRVRRAWSEGPGRSTRFDQREPGKVPTPKGQVTWNHARAGDGGERWTQAGAGAPQDAELMEGITTRRDGDQLIIEGVGPAVQRMIDDPTQNYGFRLAFTGNASFYSGEFTKERPKLEIEWGEAAAEGADIALVAAEPLTQASGSTTWKVTVINLGTETAQGLDVGWKVAADDERPQRIDMAVEPGQTVTFESSLPLSGTRNDPRWNTVAVKVRAVNGDVNAGNGAGQFFPMGLRVFIDGDEVGHDALSDAGGSQTVARVIEQMNLHVLPFSRYQFAPEGAWERVILVTDASRADVTVRLDGMERVDIEDREHDLLRRVARALTPLSEAFVHPPVGLPGVDARPGHQVGWLPDTRDEAYRLSSLPLPVLNYQPRIPDTTPTWWSGLLSRSEVGMLQFNLGKRGADRLAALDQIPLGTVIRCFDGLGVPLTGATVEIFQLDGGEMASEPLLKADTKSSGLVYLVPQDAASGLKNPFGTLARDGSNAWLMIRASREGETAVAWLPVWSLWDWGYRANLQVATVELRFMLPSGPLDRTQDLAAGKLTGGSSPLTPAQTATLVDGDLSTGVVLPLDGWVEVDLGRDRSFGELQLTCTGEFLSQFFVATYKTGQEASQSQPWYVEGYGDYQASAFGKVEGDAVTVSYRAPGTQSRYVRILNTSGKAARITDIKLVPLRATGQ